MEKIKLEVNARTRKGKLTALRRTGWIPGIFYGRKQKPQMLQLPAAMLEKWLASEAGLNTIFDLSIDGQKAGLARIREVQADPLKRSLTHVDLQTVDLKEKIEVEVPIHIVGKAEGVKKGGVLEQQRRSLLLKCLVNNIPEAVEVDVSKLEIGQNIHAEELRLPEGVEFPHETNFTIVAVVPPTKEEEVKPAEVEAVAAEAGAAAAPAAEGEKAAGAEGGKEKAKEKEKSAEPKEKEKKA